MLFYLKTAFCKLTNEKLIEKLFSLVSKTLGSSLEQGLNIKFDYELARNSLRIYDCRLISKIEKIHIPSKVTELKYSQFWIMVFYIFCLQFDFPETLGPSPSQDFPETTSPCRQCHLDHFAHHHQEWR